MHQHPNPTSDSPNTPAMTIPAIAPPDNTPRLLGDDITRLASSPVALVEDEEVTLVLVVVPVVEERQLPSALGDVSTAMSVSAPVPIGDPFSKQPTPPPPSPCTVKP